MGDCQIRSQSPNAQVAIAIRLMWVTVCLLRSRWVGRIACHDQTPLLVGPDKEAILSGLEGSLCPSSGSIPAAITHARKELIFISVCSASCAVKMGAVERKLDAALLIVAHGSTVNPDSSAPTLAHAAEIRRRNIFADVECAFWKEEPSL